MIRVGRALLTAKKADEAIVWFDKAINAPNVPAQYQRHRPERQGARPAVQREVRPAIESRRTRTGARLPLHRPPSPGALGHAQFQRQRNRFGCPPQASSADNERLEFLGDSILGWLVSEWLFARFGEFNEGQLSLLKNHLVSANHLLAAAHGSTSAVTCNWAGVRKPPEGDSSSACS